MVKNLPANAGDMSLIPDAGRLTCHRALKPYATTIEPVL